MRKILVPVLTLLLVGSSAFAAISFPSDSSVDSRTVIPTDRRDRPQWAFQFAGSPSAFDGQSMVAGHPDAESLAFALGFEYQPTFIQKFGTLGIGPILSAYPVSQLRGVTSGFFSVWSAGLQARYQLRYWHNQWLVPVVGYEADRMRYSFTTGSAGYLNLSGPLAGLELHLNSLVPSSADDFYSATGISHTYFVAEARNLEGSDSVVSPSGLSWYLGMRMEW
jgi:hypothetical protein